MDKYRRRPGALGRFVAATWAGLAVAGQGCAAVAFAIGGGLPLKAMTWAPRGADPVAIFATQPTECLTVPAEPARAVSVEIGRAAFRTPLLLGGQAARAGLSCESCHRQGRGNPDFQFPGASGEPGTADVTLSLFSSHRGNGVHDPKPIPDLSGPRARLKVAAPDLPVFIRGLIVEEFDGHEPPPAVLNGLADYVLGLSPGACPPQPRQALDPQGLMQDASRALAAADASLAAADPLTAAVMVAAARARLGVIDERYAGLPAARSRLRAADARLGALQAQIRAGDPDTRADLRKWLRAAPRLTAILNARQDRSLFNPQRLSRAARDSLPRRPS